MNMDDNYLFEEWERDRQKKAAEREAAKKEKRLKKWSIIIGLAVGITTFLKIIYDILKDFKII